MQPEDDVSDLLPTEATLFVPVGVEIQAVLVFSRHGLGQSMYGSDSWRVAAARRCLALVEVDLRTESNGWPAHLAPEQAAIQLERVLDVLGDESGESTLANAPLITWGHSSGAYLWTTTGPFLADRLVAHIGFHGSAPVSLFQDDDESYPRVFGPTFLAVPGLFVLADQEPASIRDRVIEQVQVGRLYGAHWAVSLHQDARHWDEIGSFEIIDAFVGHTLAMRLPENASQPLIPAIYDGGVLGVMDHRRDLDLELERLFDVQLYPADAKTRSYTTTSWLPNTTFADQWFETQVAQIGAQ